MNIWQVSRQLKYLLGIETWDDSPNDVVFGANGTYITAGIAQEAVGRVRMPCVLLKPGDAQVDEENDDLITQEIELQVVAVSKSDPMGEHVLIGGPRASEGQSAGKGVLELMAPVLSAVGEVGKQNGVSLRATHASQAEVAQVDGLGFVSTVSLILEAVCVAQKTYAPVHNLKLTNPSGTQVTLTWDNPATRFDSRRIVVRRASGDTPPASITAGTDVALAGNFSTSVTEDPGAGTFSYAVFAVYDERGDSADGPSSASLTGRITV